MRNCRAASPRARSRRKQKVPRPLQSKHWRRSARSTTHARFFVSMTKTREVIVVGGGIAGLSAAIYLGRAQRDVAVIDSGHSMAKWEPVVQNYLGFPDGVGGEELLKNGRT